LSIIKTENLSYVYSKDTPFEKLAIDNINIEINKNDLIGIIGHTGSGKSTLIQHLNGLLTPSSGKVFLNGVDIWENKKTISKVRFEVGLVFQYPEYQLFEETVYKDIAFGPKNMGLSLSEIDKRIRQAIEFVGLKTDILEKSPFEISGGQKRRVAIAGVIAMSPNVLILDEPTAGLDPKGRDMILGQLREYHQTQNNATIIVSHSMEDIAKFAKKVLVMNKSKVFCFDDVSKVFENGKKLDELGLATPQISGVFTRLKAMGYNVNPNIYTIEQAKDEIRKLMKGEK
jgi:energy-coupling factor transport system ATP-binding protein